MYFEWLNHWFLKQLFFKENIYFKKNLGQINHNLWTCSFLRNTLEKQSKPQLVSKSWVSFHIGRRATHRWAPRARNMHRAGTVCQECAPSRNCVPGMCTERALCTRNMHWAGTVCQEYAQSGHRVPGICTEQAPRARNVHREGTMCQEYTQTGHYVPGICTERALCARNVYWAGTVCQECTDLLTLVVYFIWMSTQVLPCFSSN